MVELRRIDFSYPRCRKTLKGVGCSFETGKLTGILGPNGSGKTTLIKIAASILRQDSGEVIIDGEDASALGLARTSQLVSYVPQKIGFFPDLTVTEAVVTGRKPYMRWAPSRADKKRVAEIISLLDLQDIKDKNINEISGGEFQKTLIAQALVKEPRIILFDEPLNNLDIKNQIKIMSVIKEITAGMRLASAIVIHDINMAARYCDRFVFMKDGEVANSGDSGCIDADTIASVFGVRARIERFDGRPAVLF